MKKFFLILCFLLCMYSCCYATSRNVISILNRGIVIQYDGKIQEFQNVNGEKVYPISYEGSTYLPVRSISSLFQEQIQWNGETNSVYIGQGDLDTTSAKIADSFVKEENEDIDVLLNEDIKIYYKGNEQTFQDVNGKRVYPLSYNGTTYLPVRAISNLFDASIDWDGANNTVIIGKKNAISVIGVKVDKSNVLLKLGESVQLNAIINPINATNQTVLWSSSNPYVARVSRGKVTAIKDGKAVITVTTADGNKQATCDVIVINTQTPTTELSINKKELTLEEGKSEQLTVLPNSMIVWKSNNTDIATVENGKVTAVKAGVTSIIASTTDGGKSATCTVTVKQVTGISTGLTLDKIFIKLKVGDTEQLNVVDNSLDVSNENLIWKSSDTTVATVSNNGNVTGVKVGTTVITVTTIDGTKSGSCSINVEESKANADDARKLTADEAGEIISNAARYIYDNRKSEFAYNVSDGVSSAYKGKKTTNYLKGTSNHYPGVQTGPGKKTKFFMDCSGWCYVCIHWALNVGAEEGPVSRKDMGLESYSASSLGISTTKALSVDTAKSKLKPGDIIVYKQSHWALYVGDGEIIDMNNYGKPSYSTWTLHKNAANYWTSKTVSKIYRISDATAETVDISKIDSNYLNYYYKVR